MLHVHPGSHLLGQLEAARLAGERLEWAEVACAGPLRTHQAERLHAQRADFLDGAFGRREPSRTTREALEAQDLALARAIRRREEVVLWVGAEWFCQAALVEIVARTGEEALRSGGGLSVACPETVEAEEGHATASARGGCGFGRWPAERLGELLDRRERLGRKHVRHARQAAAALRSPDPRDVEVLARQKGPLAHAGEGLTRHLEELPHAGHGLGRTEHAVLFAIASGAATAEEVYDCVVGAESRPWQADSLVAHVAERLTTCERSLAARDGSGRYFATDDGREVLSGQLDATTHCGLDRWIGGVRANATLPWRWDPSVRGLLRHA